MAETARDARDSRPGAIVSGFWPIRSEVDVRPLMFALREKGARLCLPAILDKTTIVFRELVRGAPMVDMGFGTAGPGEEAEVLDPDDHAGAARRLRRTRPSHRLWRRLLRPRHRAAVRQDGQRRG